MKYFHLVIIFACAWQPKAAIHLQGIFKSEHEEIIDVDFRHDARIQRDVLGFKSSIYPPVLHVRLNSSYPEVNLALHHNHHLHRKIPLCTSEGCKNVLLEDYGSKDVAFYQDVSQGASAIVQFQESSIVNMVGSVYIQGQEFIVEKAGQKTDNLQSKRNFKLMKVEKRKNHGDYVVKDTYLNELNRIKTQKLNKRRDKRAATAYKVELLFVTDYSVYNFWYGQSKAITSTAKADDASNHVLQFYAFLLNAVDLRYKSMASNPFSISVVFAGLWMAKKSSDSPFTEDIKKTITSGFSVNAHTVLDSFETWTKNSASKLPDNDHAMLFSRYDLVATESGTTSDIAGLATVSAICGRNSASFVEDDFTLNTVTTAAHELGHSLGARHDGSRDIGFENSCLGSDGYIMSAVTTHPTGSKATNPWKFSSCSVAYFKNTLNALNSNGDNCLSSLSPDFDPDALSQYADKVAGQTYPVDKQCQYSQKYDSAYLCRSFYESDYSNLCTKMYCSKQDLNVCAIVVPLEGTTCGDKKWCQAGNCVSSSDAPKSSDSCPFGDTPGVVYSNKGWTCPELVSSNAYNCDNTGWEHTCCASCQSARTGIPDCEYGDKVSGCNANFCDRATDTYKKQCCQTCAPPTTSTASTTTTTTPTTARPTTTTTTTTTTLPTTTTTLPTTTTTRPTTTKTTLKPRTTTPPATTNVTATAAPEKSTGWVIAVGAVAGVIVALVVLSVVMWWCCRRQKFVNRSEKDASSPRKSKGEVNLSFSGTDPAAVTSGLPYREHYPQPSFPPPRPAHAQKQPQAPTGSFQQVPLTRPLYNADHEVSHPRTSVNPLNPLYGAASSGNSNNRNGSGMEQPRRPPPRLVHQQSNGSTDNHSGDTENISSPYMALQRQDSQPVYTALQGNT